MSSVQRQELFFKSTTINILLQAHVPQSGVTCDMCSIRGFIGIYPTFATALMSNHLSKVAKQRVL